MAIYYFHKNKFGLGYWKLVNFSHVLHESLHYSTRRAAMKNLMAFQENAKSATVQVCKGAEKK